MATETEKIGKEILDQLIKNGWNNDSSTIADDS